MNANLNIAQATALGVTITHPAKAAEVFSQVRIEDFDEPYRSIAEAIHGLRLAKADISQLSVVDEMTRRGTIGRAGGSAFVFEIAAYGAVPETAGYACQVIARTARLRRVWQAGTWVAQQATSDEADPHTLSRLTVDKLQAVIDGIEAEGDVTTPTLRDFLDTEDAPYDWVIPGLLERGDRFVLVGIEGGGKSVMLRQLAVCAAAGVHPFTHRPIPPMRVLYVDCENGPVKLRRAFRPLVAQADRYGSDPVDQVHLEAIPSGLDLTKPDDEMWLVRTVAALQPDMLIVGPLYRLHAGNPNDEENARTVTRVLDRCRAAANCALVAEAHAGHAVHGERRHFRPTGSSLWLRWPEFGYGMRPTDDSTDLDRRVELVPWRGDREERNWPRRLRSGGAFPWTVEIGEDNTWSEAS